MTSVRVLALTRYGTLGSSSRMRFLQYIPTLQQAGLMVEVQALFTDAALAARYQSGQYSLLAMVHAFTSRVAALLSRKNFDLLWIEKEALPWWPLWLESALLHDVPYVLDYDDAVFHNYDLHRLEWVRRMFGERVDGLMAKATLVVAGNNYLAHRAKDAGAPWVAVLPTVIDLNRYRLQQNKRSVDGLPRIVWIGSPSTVPYLEQLRQPLQALAERVPFILRVIGGSLEWPGVQIEGVPWTETTEVALIAECDVGVMPLQDSAWERGKCGYKLIQYMACGLPVVASPVGANNSIVQQGVNGLLADSVQDWIAQLERLLTNVQLRGQMGEAGRRCVEQQYCLQVTGPLLASWLRKVAQKD